MDIFTWIKAEEASFKQPIEVLEGWNWNFFEHIRWSVLFKHGKFAKGANDFKRPNKNIVLPLLETQYTARNINLKDVNIYVDDTDKYHLSFLVKKYHDEVYAPEHKLDTFFNETNEEAIDFGGTIARHGKGVVYEPLESIAFCDQTNLNTGPIAFKSDYSPDELYDKESLGWGKKENGADITIEELVVIAEASKQELQNNTKTTTPGKYIEVYRVHGSMPSEWLKEGMDKAYVRQMQIVAFYQNKDGTKTGCTLYKKIEPKNPFKIFLDGKKIRNRALPFGGVEKLFDSVIWTNFAEIAKKNFLQAVSKIVHVTDDAAFVARNKNINDIENNQVLEIEEGKTIRQLDTTSRQMIQFNEWIAELNDHAQRLAGSTDALMGENPTSGTPFALENLMARLGQSRHEYKKEKFADWIGEIYNEWIISDIQKELTNGTKFLATLSSDELEYVIDCVVRNAAKKYEDEKVLNGEIPYPEDTEAYKQKVREEWQRKGSKHFIELLKGELEETPLKVKVTVGSRQKNLFEITNKLSNIFGTIFTNPAILDDPRAMKVFQKILEFSGLNGIDFGFSAYKKPQTQPQQIPQSQPINPPVTAEANVQ